MTEINTEELKSLAPIIPYVKAHYPNKIKIISESNNTAFCKCIWHDEDTASLAFFQNGTYKCFGCGAHGDIITLTQNIENVSFQEACKIIGDNVGYSIALEPPNPYVEQYKNTLTNYLARYINNLAVSKEGLEYLNNRKISPQTIIDYKLGITDKEEFKYRTDIGNIANRIVFPIYEHKKANGKCIGMAYGTITRATPKYINDCNQEGRDGQDPNIAGVFIKGNTLFGFPQAFEESKRVNFVMIAEGYFDVLSLHQAGLYNVVGIMGTAMTQIQIQEAMKLSKNFLMILDGDIPGNDAVYKLMPILLKNGVSVAVCQLPNGLDPDELCKKYNYDTAKITSIIKQYTVQGMDMVMNKVLNGYSNVVLKERAKATTAVMPIINSVQDNDLRELYKKEFFNRIGL